MTLALFGSNVSTPRFISVAAATLLLLAAGFKGYALWFGVTVAEALIVSVPAQVALIQLETLLALWLLSGWRLSLALRTAGFVFASFAAVSLYLAWQGRASCGCFGTLSINPWLMLAVDVVAAIAAALAARSARMEARSASEGEPAAGAAFRSATVSLAGGLVFLSVGFSVLALAGQEPGDLLARWRGDFLRVSPTEIDLGAGPARESVAAHVTLSNVGDKPIQIVGGSTDCQCITTKDLPLTLQAGESRTVQVTIRRTGAPGVQRRRYHFFTDQQQQFRATASFVGQVVAEPATSEPRTK